MKMRKCPSCEIYTFKELCPRCNQKSINPNPPPFSPEDRYGKYRRMVSKI
ncbi:MAG: RNA-protein complex protein Nop10 [Candidatus Aenigmarchaeota archaeon]|nr:RNA-protein complex protein Nop10 [Candidatus Aenigmarchaeota archaeon]